MVSEKLFQSSPPFPDNLPLAKLSTISLTQLLLGSKDEIDAMFQACQEFGFFLLDLKGNAIGEQMITELEKIFGVINETMHVSEEDKAKYHEDRPRTFWGFKRQGYMKTETGQQDRCTFFAVPQDDLVGNIPEVNVPGPVCTARPLLKSYVQHGQQVLSLILAGLESKLSLPSGTLQELQPPNAQSGTVLRMIRGAPSITPEDMRTGLLPHTNFGSVTLLANVLGGLQVLRPSEDADPQNQNDWQWVKPQPGCLIVNVGDAMVEWTGGVLRSNLHRVNYAPGEQRLVERFALAMLVRPRRDAKMDRIQGGLIPQIEDDHRDGLSVGVGTSDLSAMDWETKKASALREGKDIAQSRGGRALRTGAVI